MNDEVELTIAGLVYNQAVVGTYGLVLTELKGRRRFSVMIGEAEAQSIALKINNKQPPRPLTHDLIKNLLTTLGAMLKKVLIYDMVNDVFYSELHVATTQGDFVIDARTSDAVALAVRCESPIYIKANIMDVVGTEIEPESREEENIPQNPSEFLDRIRQVDLGMLNLTELETLLETALKEEKYEAAVLLRDAINRKKHSH